MDLKAIKQIVELMTRSELTEFEIEEKDFKLRIRRGPGEQTTVVAAGTPAPFPTPVAEQAPAPAAAAPPAQQAAEAEAEDPNITLIKSPMVGTFYRSPAPDSPAFVEPGSKVTAETVVCIIEAMKVMNEIQAEVSGTIEEILIEDGNSIEFGQPLFKVRKA